MSAILQGSMLFVRCGMREEMNYARPVRLSRGESESRSFSSGGVGDSSRAARRGKRHESWIAWVTLAIALGMAAPSHAALAAARGF
jgi:hypothetical protein